MHFSELDRGVAVMKVMANITNNAKNKKTAFSVFINQVRALGYIIFSMILNVPTGTFVSLKPLVWKCGT